MNNDTLLNLRKKLINTTKENVKIMMFMEEIEKIKCRFLL